MPRRLVYVIGVAAICVSCSTRSAETTPTSRCGVGRNCIVQGKLVATHGTGSIRDESGCIAVALPEYVSDDWNLQLVRASGVIYRAPDYPGLVTYRLKDRVVDAEACYSGLAMYVDKIEKISSLPQ